MSQWVLGFYPEVKAARAWYWALTSISTEVKRELC